MGYLELRTRLSKLNMKIGFLLDQQKINNDDTIARRLDLLRAEEKEVRRQLLIYDEELRGER